MLSVVLESKNCTMYVCIRGVPNPSQKDKSHVSQSTDNTREQLPATVVMELILQIYGAIFQEYNRNPWMLNLASKILAGDPTVDSLLAYNPFSDKPPT